MKIAIIGAGVSGLTCAYTLARDHDIDVFEANQYAGGHANTVVVNDRGRQLPMDTGFLVYNQANYPGLCTLFDQLGVVTQPSDMSFSVHCERSGREWNGSSLNQMFVQRSNLLRYSHWQMLSDILRFHREAVGLAASLSDRVTVSDWLTQNCYSEAFERNYLLPLGASLWSCSAQRFADFPMRFVIEFLDNHHMLQVVDRPQWRTVTGGSREYVARIVQPFAEQLRLALPVRRVRRSARGVEVWLDDGSSHLYDEVILACHADQALELVADPDDTERDLLSCFPYQRNVAVLHTDTRLLPDRKSAWASWNFRTPKQPSDEVNVTYNLNLLQSLDSEQTWCLTLNPGECIDQSLVERRIVYHHPMFKTGRHAAQSQHTSLIRRRGLSYCGAYWGFGFHEDGVQSALRVGAAFELSFRLAA
jgi:uncharacterized protein